MITIIITLFAAHSEAGQLAPIVREFKETQFFPESGAIHGDTYMADAVRRAWDDFTADIKHMAKQGFHGALIMRQIDSQSPKWSELHNMVVRELTY